PRIHGVSSLQAIQEIERGELDHPHSNLRPFKQEFQQFLEGDLAEMAIQAADAEWKRGFEQLRQLIVTAKENRENREQKKEELESQYEETSRYIKNEMVQLIEKRMTQEIDELVFYLKQRVFYRFSDFFKESFNPAALGGSRPMKVALSEAMKELLEAVGYDLAQEMRATSLRSEKQAHKLLAEKYETIKLHCQSIQPQLQFSAIEWPSRETPEFPAAFGEATPEAFSDTLSIFKNAKSFFEKNEKQLMQEALHNRLSELADHYLATEKEKLSKWALEEAAEGMSLLKETAASDVQEQFTAWLQVLNEAENIEEWEHTLVELERP
ncbi:MAG TPA: hypothetical protein VIR64_01770, partial [Pseudobacillus sp.]